MTKVVLIYEQCPERLDVFHLEVDDETLEKLKKCHSKFGNSCFEMTEEQSNLVTNWLPIFIHNKASIVSSDKDSPITEVQGLLIYSGFNL